MKRPDPKILAILGGTFVVVLAGAALAQKRPPELPALRMGETAIRGDRDAPRLLYQVPKGPSAVTATSRARDYGPEILEPVVAAWMRVDEKVLGP